MIILQDSTTSLKVALSAAETSAPMQFNVSWIGVTNYNQGEQVIDTVGSSNQGLTNGVTEVELIDAPNTGTNIQQYTRQINYISIYNSDSATKTVTVFVDVSGTNYNLVSWSVPVGYSLIYNKDSGWALYSTSGAIVTSITTVIPDGDYTDIVLMGSGLIWTLKTTINKAITGIWSFVSGNLRLYNAASTFYGAFANAFTANRTITFPDKDMTVAGTNDKLSAFAATTSAELAGVISNETGSGLLVFGTSPTLTTPVIVGRTDGGSASAGNVGEVITASVVASAASALTSTTAVNVTSVSLTAGDWNVSAMVGYTTGTGTTISVANAGVSLTSATLPAADTVGVPTSNEVRANMIFSAGAVTNSSSFTQAIPDYRVTLSATTTFYLVSRAVFAISTVSTFGSIEARRVQS